MYKKLTWGLGVLALLLCTAFVFMTVLNRAEIRQLKEEAAEAEKLSEDRNKHLAQQPNVDNKPPREAKDGFKWEWHGDHWHEMPVAQNEVPQQPIVQPVQTPKTYDGPLTSHKELLETHPVEALYQQTLERGHWSARHIPPFPPDDQEAAALARNVYLLKYYESIGQTDTPEYHKLIEEAMSLQKDRRNIEDDARRIDLLRLTFVNDNEDNFPWEWFIHKTHFSPPFRP